MNMFITGIITTQANEAARLLDTNIIMPSEASYKVGQMLNTGHLDFILIWLALILSSIVIVGLVYTLVKKVKVPEYWEVISNPYKKTISPLNVIIVFAGVLAFYQYVLRKEKEAKEIFGESIAE